MIAIRRRYRLLQRAADLNIALPDESLQVRSLSNIVKKTAEQHADFKFRVALAKTELQIDSRPSQANVMRFLQHLLAELEQLGGGSRKPASTTSATSTGASATTTTSAPSLKGIQQGTEDAKAKPKGAPPAPKKACQWFGTDVGCKNGKACSFAHSWQGLNRAERCLLCGSKQHRAKDCATKDQAGSPTRGPPPAPSKAAAAAITTSSSSTATSGTPSTKAPAAAPIAGQPAPVPSSAATSSGNKIDAAKMTEILNETNRMLKTLTEQHARRMLRRRLLRILWC